MKFSDIDCRVAIEPLGVRAKAAYDLVGGEKILALMVRAKWVKPVVHGNRLTVYDYAEIKAAWNRLRMEGMDSLRGSAGG